MNISDLFMRFEGRIGRKSYWLGILAMIAASILVTLILAFLVGAQGQASLILIFLGQLVLLYPSTAIMVKRFHDRDRSGWFVAILLVPIVLQGIANIVGVTGDPLNQGALDYLFALWIIIVSLWFLVELGFLRGSMGANRFGPDPLLAST